MSTSAQMAKTMIVTVTRHVQTPREVTNVLAMQDTKGPDKLVQVIVADWVECSNAANVYQLPGRRGMTSSDNTGIMYYVENVSFAITHCSIILD